MTWPIFCPCGVEAVFIDPGQEPEHADLSGGRLALSAGRPVSGKCAACQHKQEKTG